MNVNHYLKLKKYAMSVHLKKWGIGKHLTMVYIVETTKNDKEVKALHYSNIHQFKHEDVNSAMEHMTIMQRKGWFNINLSVQVYNREQIIIEDVAYETEFISTTELETRIENNKLKKQVEHMTNELDTYKGFISKYKAKKMLENYITEQQTTNIDNNNLYWYEMLLRPLSIGCQPKNHIQYDETKGRHGIVAYNKPLTDNEIKEFELKVWNMSA